MHRMLSSKKIQAIGAYKFQEITDCHRMVDMHFAPVSMALKVDGESHSCDIKDICGHIKMEVVIPTFSFVNEHLYIL